MLALWDGNQTEGIGGTYHLRTVAEQYGAALVTIYIKDLHETVPLVPISSDSGRTWQKISASGLPGERGDDVEFFEFQAEGDDLFAE